MANGKNPFRRIRLVYRRSSPLLKCVVLAAIVLCTVATLTLRAAIRQEWQIFDSWRSQAAELEQENQKLEKSIAELGTKQSILNIAKEKLGLVDSDSIFFDPVD